MSTYILMKILESAPNRYDRGIRILTLGTLDSAYDRLISRIEAGQRVLDVGCGTGALSLRAAARGASVKGIDVNPQMLEIAESRALEAGCQERIEFCETGAAELGDDPSGSYDVVMSGLCFSELTEGEQVYALKEARRLLKPEGLLLLADETIPPSAAKKILNWMIRLPLVVITYILTQATTRAVTNLPGKVRAAGFDVVSVRLNRIGSFMELTARNPQEPAT